MRRTEQSIDRASALASIVLPTPGTSSIKTCPSASRAMRARRTTSGLPSMTRWILARILSKVAARSSIPPISGRVVATGRAPFHDSFLVFDSRRVCEDFRFAPPGNRETSWSGDLSAAPRSMWGGARSPPRPPKRLAAARRAFAELGYAKARVEDVVTAAGVGHGTFYAYFPNKQAALAALVREHAGTLEELAMKPWRAGDVRASLAEVLGGLADLYERDADMLLLWTEAAVHDPELEAILDEVRRQFVERIARNVERAAKQGLAWPVDPFTAATALAAMAERTLFLLATRKESLDRDQTVEVLANLWYHALYRGD